MRTLSPCLVAVLGLVAFLALPLGNATASPTSPVTLESPDDALGDIFNVGFRTLEDLDFPYVEVEYLVSGEATV